MQFLIHKNSVMQSNQNLRNNYSHDFQDVQFLQKNFVHLVGFLTNKFNFMILMILLCNKNVKNLYRIDASPEERAS